MSDKETNDKVFIVENGGNSCYIDSILMALFYTPSHISGVLEKRLKNEQYSYIQDFIKLKFVDRVQKGESVRSEEINELRMILVTNGWLDFDTIMIQQDVSEFYTFLAEKFDITPIELERTIYTDNNSGKSVAEKLLFIPLSIPFSLEHKISVVDRINVRNMLETWLHHNEVDLRRPVDGEEQNVKGLSTFRVSNTPEFMVLSINRFPLIDIRNNTDVIIQKTLKPFANSSDPDLKTIEWSFHSAVCHRGDTLKSGHYYTLLFSKRDDQDVWYLFDDATIPSLIEVSMRDKNIINDIKKDCVLLVYQLKF